MPAVLVLPLEDTSMTANPASQFIIGSPTLKPWWYRHICRYGNLTAFWYTANPDNGAFVIGGQTVTPGGAITVAGTRIALPSTAAYAVVSMSTIPLQGSSPDVITCASSTYKPISGIFTIGGPTLTPCGAITIFGTCVALSLFTPATPCAVIGSSTIPLAPTTIEPDLLTFGGQVYTANSLTGFVIGRQTLRPGGAVTVDGVHTSFAPAATDAVVGTNTIGIGGLMLNRLNGGGDGKAGGNGSMVQFFGGG